MKITAKDLKELGIVDEIVGEPEGARTPTMKARAILDEVAGPATGGADESADPELLDARYEKSGRWGNSSIGQLTGCSVVASDSRLTIIPYPLFF